MIFALLTLALLAGASIAVAAYALMPWRRLTKRHAMIGLVSGNSLDGVILRKSGPLLTIGNARRFTPQGEPVPVDGEITIERRHIEFIQTGHAEGPRSA